ncbi:DUF4278 domain-containing protein [Myxosarcina sp. GI1(2024)]
MQLLYRGINYHRQLRATIENPRLEGKYRGVNWRSHEVQPISINRTNSQLTYRGISYR